MCRARIINLEPRSYFLTSYQCMRANLFLKKVGRYSWFWPPGAPYRLSVDCNRPCPPLSWVMLFAFLSTESTSLFCTGCHYLHIFPYFIHEQSNISKTTGSDGQWLHFLLSFKKSSCFSTVPRQFPRFRGHWNDLPKRWGRHGRCWKAGRRTLRTMDAVATGQDGYQMWICCVLDVFMD